MKKLYKRIEGALHYHEAWVAGGVVTEHRGAVGERGSTRQSKVPPGTSEEDAIAAVLGPARDAGYAAVDMKDHARLIVEYKVNGFGTEVDLRKRYSLEEKLNQITGWTGLGHCDGGSIGSDTMEACCFVVDFEIAKRVVADALAMTPFADFTRIYDEDAEIRGPGSSGADRE